MPQYLDLKSTPFLPAATGSPMDVGKALVSRGG
jgi:hypothetical protein